MLLLMGKARVGKSSIAKSLLLELGERLAMGLYTEEIVENGERVGFNMVNHRGEVKIIAHINFSTDIKVARYCVDINGVDEIMLPIIEEAINEVDDRVLILDEIGFMQLSSPSIRSACLKLLDSKKRIIATTTNKSDAWIDNYKSHQNIKVIEITMDNRVDIKKDLLSLCRLS